MVSVDYALSSLNAIEEAEHRLLEGLTLEKQGMIEAIIRFIEPYYENRLLETGESLFEHVIGTALNLARLNNDFMIRAASLLYLLPIDPAIDRQIIEQFGEDLHDLTRKVTRIQRLRPIAREFLKSLSPEAKQKTSGSPKLKKLDDGVLHKILLASAEDFRVVLIRLASRTQTMRFLVKEETQTIKFGFACETMEIYAPLANRLGLWQYKWELEDYSFRIIEPDLYKKIAKQINEKRGERERFIDDAIARLKTALTEAHIECELSGRPKHIYSIYNKMRRKNIDFDHLDDLYDIRAIRVLVDKVEDCYAALDIAHRLWEPIPEEFDDYIQQPKENAYQSLHTAVRCADGRSLEVQIRTFDMHEHAEQGVAAHWRYKEGSPVRKQDDKIQLLRQLLQWQNELLQHTVEDNSASQDLSKALKVAGFDQTIYVLTPEGDVVDLPQGATPVDMAYHLHTDLGHRCRGAKVDGHIVPLNYPLQTLQQVEILASKQETGPSRDWLNPDLGFLKTHRGKTKVRQWFNRQEQQRNLMHGRAIVYREMQREGVTGTNLETIAHELGFKDTSELFLAVRRPEFSLRALQSVLRGDPPEEKKAEEAAMIEPAISPQRTSNHPTQTGSHAAILIDGVDGLVTQLAKCCKPIPPDEIVGFLAHGRGVSIHRADCQSYSYIAQKHPERVVKAQWGQHEKSLFMIDAEIEADDRKGLLKDIIDSISKSQLNIGGINTATRSEQALLHVSLEVPNMETFQRAVGNLLKIEGVRKARRL